MCPLLWGNTRISTVDCVDRGHVLLVLFFGNIMPGSSRSNRLWVMFLKQFHNCDLFGGWYKAEFMMKLHNSCKAMSKFFFEEVLMSGWSKSGCLSSRSIRTFSSATAIGFRWCFNVARSTRTGRCLATRPSLLVTSTCHKYFSTRLIRRCTCTPTQRNSRRLSHRSWYCHCAASRLTTTTGVKRHPWMSVRCRSGCGWK